MAFQNRGKIRILRGHLDNDSNNEIKNTPLWDGQPFYDKDSRRLMVGDSDGQKIQDAHNIVADANNIVFNCSFDSNVLSCEIPGYKKIKNQRAFFICGSDIASGIIGVKLEINNGNPDDVTLPSDGIKKDNLYNIEWDNTKWVITFISVELIQGINLSANKTAQFGDYIVSKKKLLWSGDASIEATSPTEICSLSEALNSNAKAVEFICSSTGNGNYSIKMPFKNTGIDSGHLKYVIDFGFYPSSSTPYITYTELYLSYNLSYTFNVNKFYGYCKNVNYYINTSTTKDTEATMNVTKIYEIIE